ncbi:MAG: proline--tRNA ligase [Pseudomonadota bacterium]
MRSSQLLLSTLRETPSDAEVISHQLMLRAGMIRRLSNGLYSWLPVGLRVLRKIEAIIREEMNQSGAMEVLMPVTQPANLWSESGRWEQYGPELLRIVDRHNRDYCLGPTHEEVVTDLMRNELSSYKQLPVNLYQIQTKFRDEIRPRFGVMRSREFIMKDSYSFHLDEACLANTYQTMYDTYTRIFTRLGLNFRAVNADTGSIGGNASHEFHVLADSGEDAIAFSDTSNFSANVELAASVNIPSTAPGELKPLTHVDTPNVKTIDELSQFLNISAANCLKTLLVEGTDQTTEQPIVVALVLRGDHTLNEIKAEKLPYVNAPLTFVSEEHIDALNTKAGFVGPINLSGVTIISDYAAANAHNFVCGANTVDQHVSGVNWGRDCKHHDIADLRNVVEGDPSPDGKGTLTIKRGIEVGHIFQLGDKYSRAMNLQVLTENQSKETLTMGCYGIGVTRVVAAAIEQNHDEHGIKWPENIAPFTVALIPINLHKSDEVKNACEALYEQLNQANIDTLFFDEPKLRLGATLANAELIGVPYQLVIGGKGLEKGEIELKIRRSSETVMLSTDNLFDGLMSHITPQ